MSLVLWLLTLVLLGITGWGIQSVMTELAKPYPQQPFNTVSRGFEVEDFIWSSTRATRIAPSIHCDAGVLCPGGALPGRTGVAE